MKSSNNACSKFGDFALFFLYPHLNKAVSSALSHLICYLLCLTLKAESLSEIRFCANFDLTTTTHTRNINNAKSKTKTVSERALCACIMRALLLTPTGGLGVHWCPVWFPAGSPCSWSEWLKRHDTMRSSHKGRMYTQMCVCVSYCQKKNKKTHSLH